MAANIFEALREHTGGGMGEEAENFEPQNHHTSKHWRPTQAPAGSMEKMAVLRRRLTLGLPLWHPEDNPMSVEKKG